MSTRATYGSRKRITTSRSWQSRAVGQTLHRTRRMSRLMPKNLRSMRLMSSLDTCEIRSLDQTQARSGQGIFYPHKKDFSEALEHQTTSNTKQHQTQTHILYNDTPLISRVVSLVAHRVSCRCDVLGQPIRRNAKPCVS